MVDAVDGEVGRSFRCFEDDNVRFRVRCKVVGKGWSVKDYYAGATSEYRGFFLFV